MQKFRLLQDSTTEIIETTDENRHLATTPHSASMFSKGAARESYTEAPNGKACFRNFRAQHSRQEISQNQWRKGEKQFLQGSDRMEFWLFPQTTLERGRANLLPPNKPSSKRNGRELAMNAPKYTWKKLEKSIKKLKHKHKAHTTFYWEREDLRKLGGKDSTYCPRLKNQKS